MGLLELHAMIKQKGRVKPRSFGAVSAEARKSRTQIMAFVGPAGEEASLVESKNKVSNLAVEMCAHCYALESSVM